MYRGCETVCWTVFKVWMEALQLCAELCVRYVHKTLRLCAGLCVCKLCEEALTLCVRLCAGLCVGLCGRRPCSCVFDCV